MIADVLHAATNNRHIDGDDIRLVNEGTIASFLNYRLQSSSGKHIEEINHAHIVCLLSKLITSAGNTDDLFIGFDRDREGRKRKLTNNKKIKGKYHVTIMLKDIFGFGEHKAKVTYGLGYKLTLTRNSDNAVLNKGKLINNAKFKINSTDLYVPHHTPSLAQKNINGSGCKEKAYRTSIYREVCFHERGNNPKLMDFSIRHSRVNKCSYMDYCRFATK